MLDLIAGSIVVRSIVLLGVFAAIALLAFYVITLLARRSDQRRALAQLASSNLDPVDYGTLRTRDNETAWAKMIQRIEQSGLSLADTKDDRLRTKLREAGFDDPSAPRILTLVRLSLVFALPGLFILAVLLMDEPPSFLTIYLVGSILGLLGLVAPNLALSAMAERRSRAIINGFPDCLDLMLVCIEAGLGIEAAMDRVGREVVAAHPEVAELLSATVLQLRAGASREEAFRSLSEFAGVEEIRSFATLLIQSDKLGTSVGSTLRVYSEEMREKRRMRAEEKAHRLPVLISIPLVVFMLPVMIGVLMLPAGIRVVRQIAPALMGG